MREDVPRSVDRLGREGHGGDRPEHDGLRINPGDTHPAGPTDVVLPVAASAGPGLSMEACPALVMEDADEGIRPVLPGPPPSVPATALGDQCCRVGRVVQDGLVAARNLLGVAIPTPDDEAEIRPIWRQRWALVSLDIGFDTGTPSGRAMASMMAVFSQLERELIGQRTRDALRALKAKGVQLGRPRQLPAEVAAQIAELRKAGATLQSIADRLNNEHVPTAQAGAFWRPSSVRAVLHYASPAD